MISLLLCILILPIFFSSSLITVDLPHEGVTDSPGAHPPMLFEFLQAVVGRPVVTVERVGDV